MLRFMGSQSQTRLLKKNKNICWPKELFMNVSAAIFIID